MKPIQARENARKLKVNPYQTKNAQSQSPLHKKLLKKIEMTHKEPTNKYDKSLKDNLFSHEPEEEEEAEEGVVDFRVEIERRYSKSFHNQIYTFPKNKQYEDESADENHISSVNDSFEGLRHVTVYDLSSQNNKRKQTHSKPVNRMTVTNDNRATKSTSNLHGQDIRLETTYSSFSECREEEKSGVPLELRIRDKTSATYKKLLNLLHQQLNPKPEDEDDLQNNFLLTEQQPKIQQQQPIQEQKSKAAVAQPIIGGNMNGEYSGNMNTQEDVEVHRVDYKKKMERNVKSQGRHHRVPYNLSEFQQRQAKAISTSGLQGSKKNLSQERVAGKGEIVQVGSSAVEKNFSYLSSSTAKGDSKTTVDLNKMTQEGFKKLYSSNLMKSITPQYNKSNTNIKENAFKTNIQEKHSGITTKEIMDNLYQKAKNDVMNHKLKVPQANASYYQLKNVNTSNSTTKRDETPKEVVSKVNFNTFYGSPDVVMNKSAKVIGYTSQNNITKKESVRAFQMSKKPNEAPVYASYEFASKPKIAKQPSFKIEGNKRGSSNRDSASTARNRKIRTPDRCSEVLNTDPGVRNSYEMPNYSSVLNSSTQKNTDKKKIGFTPNSTAKNLSFTKTFFTYK